MDTHAVDSAADGPRYYRYSRFLRERFGCRVQKVSVDAGLSCPNRDGTKGRGGCIYCREESFSPSRRGPRMGIAEQVRRGIEHLRRRSGAERFIAYFQPGTNTHGPVDLLRRLYGEAIEHPAVVGLAVSTRPDCAGEDVLDVLSELAGRTYVSVEYGLQTIHEATLRRLNRGHDYAAFVDAVERTGRRGLDMCAHVILGLPGEDAEAMWATARELGRLRLAGVKLHNLHVVRGTVLADLYERGQVRLLDEDEYVAIVSRFLEYLDPRTAIHRLIADVPRDYLVAPAWCLDKERVRRRIEADLVARDTRQGARWHG